MKTPDLRDTSRVFPFVLFLIILSILVSRLIMLFHSPLPNGLDGAYYAMEFRSVMERGHLENREFSPLYWIGGGISKLAGSAIRGGKITSALLSALLAFSVYYFIRSMKDGDSNRALLGALLIGISPSITQLSINYLNNLIGLSFALISCSLGLQLIKRFRVGKFILFLIVTILTLLSHKVAAVYLCVVFIYFFTVTDRRKSIIILTSLIVIMALVFLFFWKDVERFSGVFSLTPVLPVFSHIFRERIPHSILIEISLYFCLSYIFLLYFLIRGDKRYKKYLLVPLFFFPFWNQDVLDMGYRLMLSSVPAGVLFLSFSPLLKWMTNRFEMIFIFLALPVIFIVTAIYSPERDPDYGKYLQVIETINLDEDSLLIAHHGINHLYTYEKSFKDALNYVPDFPVPVEKLWRLAYRVPYGTVVKLYPDGIVNGLIQKLPYNYVLIREDVWQQYLLREDVEIVKLLNNWYNPYRARPGFIR